MNNKLASIYRITNKITNATYIGQTTLELKERLRLHFSEAKNGKDSIMYNAMIKYGFENFSIEKIDETFYRHRHIVEQYYIEKELKRNIVCYNKNVKSDDFKEIMSIVTKGSKNGMYGKKDENAVNGQKVYMLDDNNNVVKEFNSVKLALEYLNTKSHTALNAACKEGKKYKGYYWKKTNKNYL